jgi:hypothetical protein
MVFRLCTVHVIWNGLPIAWVKLVKNSGRPPDRDWAASSESQRTGMYRKANKRMLCPGESRFMSHSFRFWI